MPMQQTTISTISDKDIMQDMLSTEKYISDYYDMAIMESANEQVRNAFRHIQDEEQQHAKTIFDAMNQRGWYTPK